MNSGSKDTVQQFKECARKGCSEHGIHYLKVRFINKWGWFCDLCKTGLIDDNLVVTSDQDVAIPSKNT